MMGAGNKCSWSVKLNFLLLHLSMLIMHRLLRRIFISKQQESKRGWRKL
jgi:hypothetical protein